MREIDRAIEIADDAFSRWRRTPIEERAEILRRAGELMTEREDQFAHRVRPHRRDDRGPACHVRPGGVHDATSVAVVGDYQMAVLGLRQDMTFKLLDQAVITDAAGEVVYKLPQQDMVALRVTFRAGFAVANPVNRDGPGGGNQYPFAVLQNAT